MINYGQFLSHSKQYLPWKVECDDFTDADLEALAKIIANQFEFGSVYGIPRGGLGLGEACMEHITEDCSRLLIVDDVFTTGKSMLGAQKIFGNNVVGVVIFNRGLYQMPHWVNCIFTVSKWAEGIE